jgi:hypothetical protein
VIISIDPGLNNVGVALWGEQGALVYAGLVRNPTARDKKLPRPEVWSAAASAVVRKIATLAVMTASLHDPIGIVVEIPKVRQRGSGKGDPNDLIDVAGVAAACVASFKVAIGAYTAWAPYPEEWKGQLPKAVSELRVSEKLSELELQAIEAPPPGLMHNVIDAIHLGLVHFKRA